MSISLDETEQRRLWAMQLRQEHADICYQYRVALRPPAFEITDNKKVFGAWVSMTRTIRINAGLIKKYQWDVVINILKHEMAHQYVDECLGRGSDKAHGPAFREACKKLGVLSEFSSAAGHIAGMLRDSGRQKTNTAEAGIRGKVEKLLSLAQSSNENEAAAAMRKANAFIRKYNLSRLETLQKKQYGYYIINHRRKRLDIIRKMIASILMDYFFVDIVYSSLYDAETCESYKTIELIGAKENVIFARYVYDFLLERTEYLWQSYKKKTRASQRKKRSYVLGVVKGFREKLAKDENKVQPKNGATTSALILAADAGLIEFVNIRFPRLRKIRGKGLSICAASYSAGKEEGVNLVIHKGIDLSDEYQGRLLESETPPKSNCRFSFKS